jgi:hypothetical protein
MPRKYMSGYYRSIVLAILFLSLLCSAVAVAADCPSGCSCLLPADAKAKGYDPCSGQLSVCGYDRYQNTMYCYKTGLAVTIRTLQPLSVVTTPTQPGTCSAGCSCMLEADAKAKFGVYSRCSETPCYTVTTGSAQLSAYCFREGPVTTAPAPSCPGGCSCISEATAKARGGSWSRCSAEACGYEQSTATLAAIVNVPKYCMKQESTTPVCPQGCTCLSDANAKARYRDYTRCSADVCGYELNAPTNALAATQVPKYCVKQAETTPVCPEGCTCLSDVNAKERYGTYTRCQADPCGYEMSTLTTAAYQIPKYCVKEGSAPVCPDGCACISDEDAKLKGFTDRCDNSQTPCGYKTAAATTTNAAQRIPLSCYKIPATTPVCREGCYCLREADAQLKFGPDNYTQCQADICGYDPSATTANGIPKYCFRPTVTPTPSGCPAGCICTTNGTAGEKGLAFCGGTMISCGYDEDKQPRYCFLESPPQTCVYDYQKNLCSGTCTQGYTCGLLASQKDATGKVTYGVCGCTGQPTTPCVYDRQKNACTGTCPSGAACSVVGKNVDEKTGATMPVCGCPQQSSCTYNYDKEVCVGTCTVTGENCQLNTIYRDPASGKVTYAECHCKGGGDTTPACACDAAIGSCSGICADGKACTMAEQTTDNAGKVVCSMCECRETCVLTANNECSGICLQNQQPCLRIVTRDDSGQEKVSCGCGGLQTETPSGAATRQPGFFEAIGNFFNKLFGGK